MATVMNQSIARREASQTLIGYTHVIYALHAFSVLLGITTAATIIGGFLFGLPSIVAVVMNYLRRSEVRGTWLESHFSWQIRTFWGAAIISIVSFLVAAPLMLVFIGFLLWWCAVLLTGAWILYRVLRGWLRLKDGRVMYGR
jgi:uncharacterized membrane protein